MHVTEQGLFNPSHATISEKDSVGIGLTRKTNIELEIEPNLTIRGYKITQPGTTNALLYFGGNGSKLFEGRKLLDSLCIRFNADVFSFDWRGYGFSDGVPSLSQIMIDALAIFDFVKSSSNKTPILIGRSLGSGIATYVSGYRKPKGLILISPLANLNTVIRTWSHFLPWYQRPFVSMRPDSMLESLHPQPIEVASQIDCPVLFFHGDKDELIPIQSAEELFNALNNVPSKKFISLLGKNHYNVDIMSSQIAETIENFIYLIK